MKLRPEALSGAALGMISIHGGAGPEADMRKEFRVFGHHHAVFLWQGSGRYEDSHGQRIVLRPGDLILGFPGLGHRYGPEPGGNWRELFLVFDGPVFELWEQAGLLRQDQPVWHLEPVMEWKARFEEIVAACGPVWEQTKTIDPHLQLRNICRLQQFLADAVASHTARHVSRAELRWARAAAETMEVCRDVRATARKMGLSHAHFRRRFTCTVGTSPTRYLAARQIEDACRLMQETDLSDYEIAERMGFSDAYHFSRRFKQITSQTPREYRRSLS